MTKRTVQQNKSLHKYCQQMADSLNDAGIDQVMFFKRVKEGANIPWTMESFKHVVFRQVVEALYQDPQTSSLDTVQIQRAYEIVNDKIMEITDGHVSHPWPSKEEQFNEAMGRRVA